MAKHYLRTEARSQLDAIDLAWDKLLRFDGGADDRRLIEVLLDFYKRHAGTWVLLGQEGLASYMEHFAGEAIHFEKVTVPSQGALTEGEVQHLTDSANELSAREDCVVFICLADRFDAHRVISRLPSSCRTYTFDVLKDLLGDQIPASSWRKTFDHIYPIEVPSLEVQSNLDVLLIDLPARSLAQLPIGFAYVYKAVRAAGVSLQAIDVDLIAYHRYHSRRCLNYVDRIHSEGMVHPQDPWQAENYIVWTDKAFVEYFSDILDELTEKIIAAKPKVVGLSLHQTSAVSANRVVARLREALPDIVIVVGGMSCYQHFVAQRIFPLADYVVVGEADTVVGPLMAALSRGEHPKDVPGVVSRYDSDDREYVAAPLPHNLDIIGGPDYGFTNLDWYVNWNGYRLMPLVGSRGCGWSRCTFCAERFNWRARTPELVAEEIEYYTTRGFNDFVFNESDFNSNLSFVTRLCNEIIRRGIKARFTSQLRIGKDCDFEYYKTMKEAGFSCLRFGVDGLSENTLRLQRKGYTKDMVMQNLKHCHDLGIYTEINLVIGVPGETDADVEESADFIIQMQPYLGRVAFINPLMLFVGSVYYFEPERHNIKFHGDKDELYRQYFVSLPDSAWYSEEPYIDHEIRRKRFFRIVDRIHSSGVPLGAFANFTAEYRKTHQEDSHTVTQQKPTADEKQVAVPASVEVATEEQKTEFQKTFYGSWSSAFLSGWSGPSLVSDSGIRVVNLGGKFFFATDSVVEKSQLVTIYSSPQLLRSYKGYNLVGYRDEILAAPLMLGPLDLTDDVVRADSRILKTASEEDATKLIDVIEAARHLTEELKAIVPQVGRSALNKIRSFFAAPSLLRTYKDYNLVAYREEILAAPLSLGHVDLTQDAARADRRILKGKTEEEVVSRIDELQASEVPVRGRVEAEVPRSRGGLRKVNMKPGVLLRWGK